jgi:hypothetical protein
MRQKRKGVFAAIQTEACYLRGLGRMISWLPSVMQSGLRALR